MKILAATALLAAIAPAQADVAAPTVTDLNRYADGSCGGVLNDAAGSLPFHLAFTAYSADLWLGATHRGKAGARRVEPGSAEEEDLVARLLAWSRAAFVDAERTEVEAADDVHHRGSDWSFERYREAAVVNRLAHYRRIRGATITAVIRGRGTVVVSFKVRDGLGKEQLVLFRAVNDAFGRPHLADAVEPVTEGSPTERWIVQAMHAYTQAHIEPRFVDLIWSGAEIGLNTQPRDAADILLALVNYMNNTSPRLVNVGYVKDGGSVDAAFVDARGRPFKVWFDQAIDSKISGRIKLTAVGTEESRLVEVDSVEEQQLLMQLDNWLARHQQAAAAAGHSSAKIIAERLARYREVRQEVDKQVDK